MRPAPASPAGSPLGTTPVCVLTRGTVGGVRAHESGSPQLCSLGHRWALCELGPPQASEAAQGWAPGGGRSTRGVTGLGVCLCLPAPRLRRTGSSQPAWGAGLWAQHRVGLGQADPTGLRLRGQARGQPKGTGGSCVTPVWPGPAPCPARTRALPPPGPPGTALSGKHPAPDTGGSGREGTRGQWEQEAHCGGQRAWPGGRSRSLRDRGRAGLRNPGARPCGGCRAGGGCGRPPGPSRGATPTGFWVHGLSSHSRRPLTTGETARPGIAPAEAWAGELPSLSSGRLPSGPQAAGAPAPPQVSQGTSAVRPGVQVGWAPGGQRPRPGLAVVSTWRPHPRSSSLCARGACLSSTPVWADVGFAEGQSRAWTVVAVTPGPAGPLQGPGQPRAAVARGALGLALVSFRGSGGMICRPSAMQPCQPQASALAASGERTLCQGFPGRASAPCKRSLEGPLGCEL